MTDQQDKHTLHLEYAEKNQKESFESWKKEQETYSSMIHGELIELGETKLVVTKLKE